MIRVVVVHRRKRLGFLVSIQWHGDDIGLLCVFFLLLLDSFWKSNNSSISDANNFMVVMVSTINESAAVIH